MTYAHRHPWLTTLAGVAFFFLACLLIGTNDDETAEQATAQSVVNLGAELRTEHRPAPGRDPLFGQPYKELCRDVGQGKEICR